MKGLDTNVLVRYLVHDDAEQAARAARYIEHAIATEELLLINVIVLCELTWVLESAYDFKKEIIGGVLEKILMTQQFEVEEKDTAWAALGDYRQTGADFADCLIGRKNRASGCVETATFDKALKRLGSFRLL